MAGAIPRPRQIVTFTDSAGLLPERAVGRAVVAGAAGAGSARSALAVWLGAVLEAEMAPVASAHGLDHLACYGLAGGR